MRVTVTASRGNPLAWPIALLFTIVGAALIGVGFTVVGKVTPTDRLVLGGLRGHADERGHVSGL